MTLSTAALYAADYQAVTLGHEERQWRPVRSGQGSDRGKMIMIPVAAVALLLDIPAIVGGSDPDSAPAALRWLNAILTCAFYGLIVWCYLRRGRAVATSGLTSHPSWR